MNLRTASTFFALMSVAAFAAAGAEFTLKEGVSGLFDWTDGNNYAGGVAPTLKELASADRDSVVVPDNVEVVISNVMAGSSLELINSLSRIRPGLDSRIVFSIAEGAEVSLDCTINSVDVPLARLSKVVKEGGGLLYLSGNLDRYKSNGHFSAFYVDFDIMGGTLKFNQSVAAPDTAGKRNVFGVLFLNGGATLIPPNDGDRGASYSIYVAGFSGAGTLKDPVSTKYRYVYTEGGTSEEPQEFSGTSDWSICPLDKTYLNLTGTNNVGRGTLDITGNNFVDGGRLGVRKFGKQGQPSSIGLLPSGINMASRKGFWLTSLRRQEDPVDECNKTIIMFYDAGAGRVVLDGGAVGGFKYVGKIMEHSTNPGQKCFMLTGSNTEECVFTPNVSRTVTNAYPTGGYSFHLTKRGTGTWFLSGANAISGVIAVEEGTLKFNSVASRFNSSSLGTARDLYRQVTTKVALTETDQEDYALLLGDGSDGCEGNLEYCGSANASITDRPLAVNGKGRLTNASGYNFTFADVCTKGASSSTLTLDGDDVAARNVLTGVNDSKDESGGALSIVKEGQCTWILKDDVSLRGSIEVKKGMLVVENMYTWYKWVIKSTKYETYKETQGTEPGNTIAVTCSEFGLYSADGGRQNAGLTYKRAYPNLKPGEIDYGFVEADKLAIAGNVWMADVLCDGMTTTPLNFWYRTNPDMDFAIAAGFIASGGIRNVPHHVPEQETTWLPVVMRLADDALPVARYDYATSGSGWTSVYRSRLYASVDGVNWDELEDEDRVEMPSGKWEIADREFVGDADNVHTNALGEVDGQLIASVPEKYRSGYMENVKSYSVSAGATLRFRGNARIRGLKFGYGEETGGVIEGADFAGAGTLEITDFPKSAEMAVMNYTLRNCTGFDNVARWAISENGSVNPRLSASVKDGRIVVVRNGMVIFVR